MESIDNAEFPPHAAARLKRMVSAPTAVDEVEHGDLSMAADSIATLDDEVKQIMMAYDSGPEGAVERKEADVENLDKLDKEVKQIMMAYDSGPSATELAKVDAENLDEEVKNIMKSIDKSIMTFDSAIIDTAPILPPAPTPKNPGIMEKLKGLYSKRDRSKRQIKRTKDKKK